MAGPAMADDKITLADGGVLTVWSDFDENDNPRAILFMDQTLDFVGETIEIPGAKFRPAHGTKVHITANVSLRATDVTALIAKLQAAVAETEAL